MEKDGLCFLCANFIESKSHIRILKHRQETEVSGIIRYIVENDLTLVSIVYAPCLNKANSFDAFQLQVSAALKVLKDTEQNICIMTIQNQHQSMFLSRILQILKKK